MNKLFLALLLAFSLLLCGCSARGGDMSETGDIRICRLASQEQMSGNQLFSFEAVSIDAGEIAFDKAVSLLNSSPKDTRMNSVFPRGVEIVSADFYEGVAALNMNSAYLELTGITKTIADYGMVITLCSVPGVSSVSILCEGELLQSELSDNDVVLKNTVISDSEAELRLYFPKVSGEGLGYEYRKVRIGSDDSPERRIMDELLAGPESPELMPAFPPNTVPPSIYTQDKICSVNFSEGFLSEKDVTQEEAILTIDAIVSSLTSLADVDSVRILINGKSLPAGSAVFSTLPPAEMGMSE